ncbi:MAG TPA: PQQ-binding-like beta-propeller repeat protein [Terriglobales bacterium]
MTQVLRNVFLFLLIAASAAAQPTITSISPTTASRSSRLLIQGTGFGAAQGSGHVTVAGITALLTRWSDTLIAAYVPESALIGGGNVQVFNSQGAGSNLVQITVTSRPAPVGQIRWRFQADGDYIPNRPAVGGDGTVYAQDVYGHLYAVDSTGGLKWIFNASGYGFGDVSVGQDGTIYVGSAPSIFALTPNGTLKWQFNQNPAAFILLGPNVGPDGNIYAVGTQGMGVFSLTPQGSLRWSVPENYDRPPVTMQEIVFGPAAQSRLYFHANNHLRGIGLNGAPLFTYADGLDTLQGDPQPAVGPDGSVYTNLQSGNLGKFDNNGNLLWHILDLSNVMSTPDVGPDGRIYDGQNLINLYAINSNGTVQWQYTDNGILFGPVVSPLNDLLLIGGRVDYGQPGFFEAVSTAGTSLWKEVLPVENGLNIVPMSRARFTPDGQTAYIGTSIAGQSGIGYSYLYSVQTGNSAVTLSSLTLNPTTVVGGAPSTGTVTLSGPAPSGGAVVSLTSDNPSVARVPATVTVSAGQTTASFTATTTAVSTATRVTITASYGTGRVSATLTVNPPSLVSLTLVPTTVRGGTPSTGTVVLNGPAPAGGVVVRLSSSNPILVNVPSSVTVAAGSTSASFTARTRFTPTRTVVTVSAWNGTVLKRATLTVTP